jgi:putative membrane protein
MKGLMFALLVGGALGAATPAPAQELQDPRSVQGAAVTASEFVETAAVANMFEIESSKLALEQAQDEQVRMFAQRMIDDHTKAGEKLERTLEGKSGLTLPQKLDQAHADKFEQLRAAPRGEFDAMYVMVQAQAHDQAVELFSTFAEEGDDAELRAFAAETLPTLESHQASVHALAGGTHPGR